MLNVVRSVSISYYVLFTLLFVTWQTDFSQKGIVLNMKKRNTHWGLEIVTGNYYQFVALLVISGEITIAYC